jgi:putative DNA methylase
VKKLIETVLPLKEINDSSIGDKARKGHPGNMHLWWNRSPIDSSAVLLKASLEDASETEADRKLQIEELTRIASADSMIHTLLPEGHPTICDPFSGFGGLTVAAQKLGLNVEAGDLNSVATLLTKAAAEIPGRFKDCNPVNPDGCSKMYFGAEGLAADINYYGKLVKKAAYRKLSNYYPDVKPPDSDSAQVYAWIWVRTMKCPNPACGCHMPMAASYVLSKTKGQEYWAEPSVHDRKVSFTIHHGICPADKETNKHGSMGAKFQCPACGQITQDSDVKRAGLAHELGMQLMAVCLQTKEGRIFIEPDYSQEAAASISVPEDLPVGSLPSNTRWFSPPGFGLTEYTDLYTPRQLLLMTTLCDLVIDVMEQISKDAVTAGMPDDKTSLSAGGTGAYAYGQAIGVYLALVIGKLANFQSSICTWDNRKGNVRAAFTRQAIPMTWVFAEGNPFSTPTGNYGSMLKNVVESVEKLQPHEGIAVKQWNALDITFPENSILFTELPYYDNVGYADLSDYFYIWLRRCLKNVYPELFEKVVTSKEELSSIPEHYANDAQAAIRGYQEGIETLFKHYAVSASDDFPSIVFFEYSKQDEMAISSDSIGTPSPFEQLLSSIINAGFSVTRIWPVRTEKPNKKFESFRVAVVFRKKHEDSGGTTRRGFINTLKRELRQLLDTAFSTDVNEEDKPIAGLGFGLKIFTEFNKVMNADGSEMRLHDAVQIIHQEVTDYLNAHAADKQTEEA